MHVDRRTAGEPHGRERRGQRLLAGHRRLEVPVLFVAAKEQQAAGCARQSERRGGDAPRPGASGAAERGVQRGVVLLRHDRAREVGRIGEQRGHVPVVAHRHHQHVRGMAGMGIGDGHRIFKPPPGERQWFQPCLGSPVDQQVAAQGGGMTVGIVGLQPALVDQADVDALPVERRARQRAQDGRDRVRGRRQ